MLISTKKDVLYTNLVNIAKTPFTFNGIFAVVFQL